VHRGTVVNVRHVVAAHHNALGKVTLSHPTWQKNVLTKIWLQSK